MMIATQCETTLPASPIYRLSLQSEPSIPLDRTRRLTDPQRPIVSSHRSFTSMPKMSATSTVPLPTPVVMKANSVSSLSLASHAVTETSLSEDDSTRSHQGSNKSRASSHGSVSEPQNDHVVGLSSIEQLMPRAYIRVCLAYRVDNDVDRDAAIEKLQTQVRKIVDAKPYLSGCVTDVRLPDQEIGRAEIRFTTKGYLEYPAVEVKTLLNCDGSAIKYDDLDREGLPPSRLRPEDVSALLPNVDPSVLAPVFRIQANKVQGGLIVSIYLHHCISDGTGLDLLTTGDVLQDDNTFYQENSFGTCSNLEDKLKAFAEQMSIVRRGLSTVPPNLPNFRKLRGRRLDGPVLPPNKPGRGSVLMISSLKISSLVSKFNAVDISQEHPVHTTNSVLMALLWRHMTRARRPSIEHNPNVKTSSLLIPVDIRRKLQEPLLKSYFGAAVDSAKAELDLDALTGEKGKTVREVSLTIRDAIARVDDSFIREAIDFANTADNMTDITDLQASCMDRATGADMYITSWLRLRTYASDLGMGLGGPDWVRKPWSRDPGSCIILPRRGENPEYYEVVVQMAEADMDRLLGDQEFTEFVNRVID